jgi:AraC-like DNA-binding protein
MYTLTQLRDRLMQYAAEDRPAAPLPGLRLRVETGATPSMPGICAPTFALVVQGAKRTLAGDKVFDYGAGQCLVVPVDMPVAGQVTGASAEKPYLAVALALQPATIAAMLLELPADAVRGAAPASGMAVATAPAALVDAVARYVLLLDCPDDLAVLGPMLEREILWRLLCLDQHALLRAIGMADSRLSQVGRAIAWIRAHYADPLSMRELADVAGMGVSTFFRQFRAVTAMSPLQYQKQVRLLEARAGLMSSAQDVAAVAFRVGYGSPSQFTREYARMFGTAPARDREQLRGPKDPFPRSR